MASMATATRSAMARVDRGRLHRGAGCLFPVPAGHMPAPLERPVAVERAWNTRAHTHTRTCLLYTSDAADDM
eukprot:8106481-Alexandrium_andersonii.AAC.1